MSAYGSGIDISIEKALKKFPISGLGGVVLGSQLPWLEATLLANGAAHVETIEYGKIVSEHPKVSTLLPHEANKKFLNGTLVKYDFAASFSSVEHSGMGRYGDPMDPVADIEAVGLLSCFVKKGGKLFLGVPSGGDSIHWNAHRIYGAKRYPLLTINWNCWVFLVLSNGASQIGIPSLSLSSRELSRP